MFLKTHSLLPSNEHANEVVRNKYQSHVNNNEHIACVMLCLSLEL
jgi:hypothetical protein